MVTSNSISLKDGGESLCEDVNDYGNDHDDSQLILDSQKKDDDHLEDKNFPYSSEKDGVKTTRSIIEVM